MNKRLKKVAASFFCLSFFCLITSVLAPYKIYQNSRSVEVALVFAMMVTPVSLLFGIKFAQRGFDVLHFRHHDKIIFWAYIMAVVIFPLTLFLTLFIVKEMKDEKLKKWFLTKNKT